jgi:hypothetical protein
MSWFLQQFDQSLYSDIGLLAILIVVFLLVLFYFRTRSGGAIRSAGNVMTGLDLDKMKQTGLLDEDEAKRVRSKYAEYLKEKIEENEPRAQKADALEELGQFDAMLEAEGPENVLKPPQEAESSEGPYTEAGEGGANELEPLKDEPAYQAKSYTDEKLSPEDEARLEKFTKSAGAAQQLMGKLSTTTVPGLTDVDQSTTDPSLADAVPDDESTENDAEQMSGMMQAGGVDYDKLLAAGVITQEEYDEMTGR